MTATTTRGGIARSTPDATAEVVDSIRATVLDYYESWYDADPARMARALHPSLAKRYWDDDPARIEAVRTATAPEMIEWAGAGEGREDALGDRSVAIDVVDVSNDIASVTARTRLYYEYLHLVRVPDGWRILNVVWRYRDGHGPTS
jgi:hypothetical protein